MTIKIKRVYDPAEEADGLRVLVDRLWPRGISKDSAKLDFWAKEISPSHELRQWYGHDEEQWHLFRERYFEELANKQLEVKQLVEKIAGRLTTLVYSSKSKWNNALALKEYLETKYPELC
jgi:uncharacterized protein YeaO (DUF488 family)